jgi:hypothetical protein
MSAIRSYPRFCIKPTSISAGDRPRLVLLYGELPPTCAKSGSLYTTWGCTTDPRPVSLPRSYPILDDSAHDWVIILGAGASSLLLVSVALWCLEVPQLGHPQGEGVHVMPPYTLSLECRFLHPPRAGV